MSVRNIVLKIQLQRQLDLPGCPLEKQRSPGAGNRADGGIANLRIRIIELRRVENVEALGAEFQPTGPLLVEDEILEEREVHLCGARSKQNGSPGISKRV